MNMSAKEQTEYVVSLPVRKQELRLWERFLEDENIDYVSYGWPESSCLASWQASFKDGCYAVIEIHSNLRSDGTVFASGCLFGAAGERIDHFQPVYELSGIWNFENSGSCYQVCVRGC